MVERRRSQTPRRRWRCCRISGEGRSELQHRLAPYKIDYNPDGTSPAYYRFHVGDDLLRLSFIYATRKDGKDILSGVYIENDNIEGGQADLSDEATTLSNASRLAVVDAMLPDRKPLAVSTLTDAEQSDASPPGKGEDSAFLRVPPQRATPFKIRIGIFLNRSG